MTQLGSDTFTRSNSSGTWGTATDGQTWAVQSGSATLNLTSNEGIATAVTVLSYIQLGSTTSADAEAVVRCKVSTTNYTAFGICLRATATNTFYRFRLNSNASSLGIAIIKTVAGTSTNLFTASFTASINTFYWIRAKAVGTNLFMKAWADGSAEPAGWTVSGTDSSITAAGNFGLNVNTTTSGDTASFDNFYAVDYMQLDSVSASESPAYTIAESSTDSVTLDDSSTIYTPVFLPSDSASVSEIDTFTVVSITSDSGTVSESNVNTVASSTSDALTASEITTITEKFLPVDASTGQEIASYQPSFSSSDTVTASDIFAGTGNALNSDLLTLTELAAYTLALSSSDSGTLSDSLVSVSFYLATLIDIALAASDIFAATVNFLPIDQVTGIDLVQFALAFAASDTGTVSEVLLANPQNNAIDILTASDNATQTVKYIPIETLVAQESLQSTILYSTTDTLALLQEILLGNPTIFVSDTLSANESVVYITAFTVTDSVASLETLLVNVLFTANDFNTLSETFLITEAVSFVDATVTTDNLTYLAATLATLIDIALSPVEVLLTTEAYQPPVEIYVLSENVSYNTTLLQNDQLSIAEVVAYGVQALPVDALTTIEQFSFALSATFIELMTASDLINEMPVFSPTEAVSTSDIGTWLITQTAQDSLLPGDLAAFIIGAQNTDTLSAGDTLLIALSLAWNEQLSVSEQGLSIIQPALQDTVTVGEIGTWQGVLAWSDTNTLSENSGFTVIPLLTDTVSPLESLTLMFSLQSVDVLVLADLLQPTIVASSTDTMTVSENSAWQGALSNGDQLIATDLLALTILQQNSDSLTASEQLLALPAINVVDALAGPIESVIYTTIFVPLDQLLVQDLWQVALSITAIDVLTAVERGPDLGIHLVDTFLLPVDSISISLYAFNLIVSSMRSGNVQGVVWSGNTITKIRD